MTTEENKIDDNNNNKYNIQMGIIFVLLLIIVVLWFFLWKNSFWWDSSSTGSWAKEEVSTSTWDYEKLSVTVIDDKRCTECQTDMLIEQLKLLPSVSWAEIVKKDFSDKWVSDYLKENSVTALPLIVFSTNNFDVSKDPEQKDQSGQPTPKINQYLETLKDWSYFLQIWASYDPFKERSEKWYLLLDKTKLEEIKKNAYMKWEANAKITWLEYSDLECPYCAKLHTQWTPEELFKKYWKDLNKVFNHFPLSFHNNAETWAEVLECLAEQRWAEAFYSLITKAYTDWKSDKDYLIWEAVTLWANKDTITKCITDKKYADKIKWQMDVWAQEFGITWTPGNVLINNATWEYKVISWAYPTTEFEKVIDDLLK